MEISMLASACQESNETAKTEQQINHSDTYEGKKK